MRQRSQHNPEIRSWIIWCRILIKKAQITNTGLMHFQRQNASNRNNDPLMLFRLRIPQTQRSAHSSHQAAADGAADGAALRHICRGTAI